MIDYCALILEDYLMCPIIVSDVYWKTRNMFNDIYLGWH